MGTTSSLLAEKLFTENNKINVIVKLITSSLHSESKTILIFNNTFYMCL